ncbi:MAG TPA: helix-turn-helix transcriptional regulator [Ktedonobacteraceae bacterium]|jgi:DNA-binding CsgD family transcriptional regulator
MMPVNEDAQSQEVQDPIFGESVRPLTRQELHVLDFLGQGYTNEDIAHTLNIAVSTVSSHVQHILKKLQVRNRVEAVLYMRHRSTQADVPRSPHIPLRVQESTKMPEARPASLRSRDPLLFLCQLNQVNRHIALYGPLHIDYAGISGDVSMAFYDAYAQQLKVHLEVDARPGEMNVEVDEMLWKHILEVAEGESNMLFASSPASSSGQK